MDTITSIHWHITALDTTLTTDNELGLSLYVISVVESSTEVQTSIIPHARIIPKSKERIEQILCLKSTKTMIRRLACIKGHVEGEC